MRNANCIDKTDVGPTFYFFCEDPPHDCSGGGGGGGLIEFISQSERRTATQYKKKYSCIQVLVSLLHVESWWMISEE